MHKFRLEGGMVDGYSLIGPSNELICNFGVGNNLLARELVEKLNRVGDHSTDVVEKEVDGRMVQYTVAALIDGDGHLNVNVTSPDGNLNEIETGQDTDDQLAFRITTETLEKTYMASCKS